METRTRLLALLLAGAGALLGAAGLVFGLTWLSACGVVLLAGATVVIVAVRPHPHPAPAPCAPGPGLLPPGEPDADGMSTASADAVPPSSAAMRKSPVPTGRYRVHVPISAEPADVVAALAQNAELAGEILAAHLWLEDTPSGTLRLVAAWGPDAPDSTPVEIGSTTLGRALASGSPSLMVEDVGVRSTESTSTWRYAVPVETGDARGVAGVDIAGARPDRVLLENATTELRPALTGALAIHVAHQQSSAARVLLEAARDLSGLADSQSVAQTLLDRAIDMASADTGSVMLVDQGVLRISAAKGLPDEVVLETRVAQGEGIAGTVLATCKPLVVEELKGGSERSRRHGIRTAVSVPISDDQGVVGVLNVGAREFSARFSRSHIDALESLGMIGAVAIRSADATTSSRDRCFDTLKALALALETKDPYSRGTTERILDLATELGHRLALTPRSLHALRVAALLHDVGMSAVGDAAAAGDRPLSTVEWGLLKVHPAIAAEVIASAPTLLDAVPIVYHHHERFDGSGYVSGLAGEDIPCGARILAVADAYTAIISHRPYRRARTVSEALHEIEAASGSQFDPRVVRALLEILASRNTSAVPVN